MTDEGTRNQWNSKYTATKQEIDDKTKAKEQLKGVKFYKENIDTNNYRRGQGGLVLASNQKVGHVKVTSKK